jgi:hypothetical protein
MNGLEGEEGDEGGKECEQGAHKHLLVAGSVGTRGSVAPKSGKKGIDHPVRRTPCT